MEKLHLKYHISQLISKKVVTDLSDDESEKLNRWLDESDENVKLYQKIMEGKARKKRDEFVDNLDVKLAWNKIQHELVPPKKVIRLKEWGVRIAAVLVVGILVSSILYVSTKDLDRSNELSKIEIQPGSSKAVLRLHNGKTVQLENESNSSIVEKDGTFISNKKGQLAYVSSEDKKSEVLYNTVKIPVGGEYQLLLSDGTKVHLNSDSEMKYPVHFTGNRRKVWVTGEVYFDVAHDKSKPFIVDVKNVEIEVLGTEFNVEGYSDNESVVTTLVNGSVKLSKAEESVVIKPNQQAVIHDNEQQFTVRTVNARNHTLWKEGIFYFEEANLSTIMEKLERWYGIKVFYMNSSLQKKRFSVEVKRYKHIKDVLGMLAKTNKVHFDIKDNTIVVRN